MKLTKSQLKRIIKEELGQIMGEEEQLTLPGVAPEAGTDSNSLMYSAFSYIDSKLDQNPELSGPDGDPYEVLLGLMQDHHFVFGIFVYRFKTGSEPRIKRRPRWRSFWSDARFDARSSFFGVNADFVQTGRWFSAFWESSRRCTQRYI